MFSIDNQCKYKVINLLTFFILFYYPKYINIIAK